MLPNQTMWRLSYSYIDTIAQEPNETFTLTLDPTTAPTPRGGLFFRDAIQVTIVDSDSKGNFIFPEFSYQSTIHI